MPGNNLYKPLTYVDWLNGNADNSGFQPINLWNPMGASTSTAPTPTAPFKTSMKLPTANLAGISQAERDRRARQAQQGFWGNMWDNMTDYVQKNPYESISGAIGVVGDLWAGYQNYKNQKNQLALARDQLALQERAYNDTNARAQEAFNMQRANWKGHSI